MCKLLFHPVYINFQEDNLQRAMTQSADCLVSFRPPPTRPKCGARKFQLKLKKYAAAFLVGRRKRQ